MVAVILPVTHNHMVKKMDAHAVTGFLQALCQLVIDNTWTCIAARMIMAERNDGRIVQDSLLQQNPNIHAHLRDTSLTQPDALDEPEVLIHEDYMSFLHLQVLHLRQHVFVDGRCRAKVGRNSHRGRLSVPAQLDGGKNLAGRISPHALHLLGFTEVRLAQLGKVAVEVGENHAAYLHRVMLRRSAPDKDREQFGFRESLHTEVRTLRLCKKPRTVRYFNKTKTLTC